MKNGAIASERWVSLAHDPPTSSPFWFSNTVGSLLGGLHRLNSASSQCSCLLRFSQASLRLTGNNLNISILQHFFCKCSFTFQSASDYSQQTDWLLRLTPHGSSGPWMNWQKDDWTNDQILWRTWPSWGFSSYTHAERRHIEQQSGVKCLRDWYSSLDNTWSSRLFKSAFDILRFNTLASSTQSNWGSSK